MESFGEIIESSENDTRKDKSSCLLYADDVVLQTKKQNDSTKFGPTFNERGKNKDRTPKCHVLSHANQTVSSQLILQSEVVQCSNEATYLGVRTTNKRVKACNSTARISNARGNFSILRQDKEQKITVPYDDHNEKKK